MTAFQVPIKPPRRKETDLVSQLNVIWQSLYLPESIHWSLSSKTLGRHCLLARNVGTKVLDNDCQQTKIFVSKKHGDYEAIDSADSFRFDF